MEDKLAVLAAPDGIVIIVISKFSHLHKAVLFESTEYGAGF
jgi:hypothetical protein